MKRITLFAAVATAVLAAFALNVNAQSVKKIKGSGNIITEERQASTDYTRIETAVSIKLTVSDRKDGAFIIQADDNIMPHIIINVSDGVLRANLGGLTSKTVKNATINIEVPYSGLIDRIHATADSNIKVIPTIESQKIAIIASGASRVEAKLQVSDVDVNLSGASSADLDLRSDNFGAKLTGASSINPLVAFCSNCNIAAQGASKVAGVLTTTDFDCESSGASSVTLSGVARTVEFEVSGASRLHAPNFVIDNCTLEASGASYAYINCLSSLTVDSTSGSKVTCLGECKTTILADPIIKK